MRPSIAFAEKAGSVARDAVRWQRWTRQRVEEAVEHVGVEIVVVRAFGRAFPTRFAFARTGGSDAFESCVATSRVAKD